MRWPLLEKRYVVELIAGERRQLVDLVRKGKGLARKIQHAQILLKADQGAGGPGWPDRRIAEAYGVTVLTVERIRQRLVEHGLADALVRRQADQAARRKIDGAAEARLVALACSPPPAGRRRWTIRPLTEKLVELEIVESPGRETPRKTLKKTNLSLG